MTTRISRSYLHSCLKVPIDPCNNCPAPIYNRPKMCLGRLTTTPLSGATKSAKTIDFENVDAALVNSGIRSLAKLYDSIPDYNDINHLPNKEFYTTLDTLRSTCCELRTKSAQTCIVEESPSTSSLSSHCANRKRMRSTKLRKNRPSTVSVCGKRKAGKCKVQEEITRPQYRLGTPFDISSKIDFAKKSDVKSYKKEFYDEIKAFQKTLEDFETELENRHINDPITECKLKNVKSEKFVNMGNYTKKYTDKPPVTPDVRSFRNFCKQTDENARPCSKASVGLGNFLKKSFSFDDINRIGDCKQHENTEDKNRLDKPSETQIIISHTPLKYSSYFSQKTSIVSPENVPPKIVIESPTEQSNSTKTTGRSSSGRKKKSKNKKQEKDFQVPFTIFNLDTKKEIRKHVTPSPIHPVARPNLAATLRAEVSKKKLKELKNNCTYYDDTPQFDWEVRKTPAWKSLSLNETHKEILSMRLATRKAEQAMQKREYELNMELMRQRVKSAPLLLEGATFWGPHIGKLTHTCQREGERHCCQSKQLKSRSKSADSRRLCTHEGIGSQSSQRSSKLNFLHKTYGGSSKVRRRSSTQTPMKRNTEQSDNKQSVEQPPIVNDSGDELSSLDRAFL
ncbi:uncharacterized protein LOC105213145 [Zeugodacus cucurbitae]|uniref:uncharacterized protein LOC105213145 n=1 Tax=Zeugodacus cucurbitae TaxID=28588 RepID=UPI0023D8EBB6|nr:uncharacterized protein LOC105213145 [Zeugodacus cucurbitae]